MDFVTLIFLVVAAIIFFRLRSVLGSRTGNERSPFDKKWPVTVRDVKKPEQWQDADKKIIAPAKFETSPDNRLEGVEPGSPLSASLKPISEADPDFRVSHFLKGAKLAYELVVTSFARGERDKLRPLLSAEMFNNFDEEISAREKRGESVDFHFVGITAAEIDGASLSGDLARVSMRFDAKMVQAVKNSKGEIVEGDASAVDGVSDIWTFERRLSSKDPNWKLVEVEDA